jgi:hypothetical protein
MTLLVISNILQWVFLLYIAEARLPVWIGLRWKETFFGKVRYGFIIYLFRHTGPNSTVGKPLFRFIWKNPDLIPDEPYCKPKSHWANPFTSHCSVEKVKRDK